MTIAAPAAPFVGYEGRVEPAWIDANKHMNVGWYDHVFDAAESALFAAFNIDEDYIARVRHGMFRLEKRIRYERELVEGDRLEVRSGIVSCDGRVLKHFHELFNRTRDMRAGTAEFVSIHVDLEKRKSARIFDPAVLEPLNLLAIGHGALKS